VRVLVVVLSAIAFALAAQPADAARFAIGLADAGRAESVAKRAETVSGGSVTSLAPMPALILRASHARGVAHIPGVTYVERIRASRRLAFTPVDAFFARQWYVTFDRAFDFWTEVPFLPAVRVAVIDSGIDAGHPELQGKIVEARSFVRGSPVDRLGHGTFVAGEIAAALDGHGIVGIAFSAELLIAKVVDEDGTVAPDVEAEAIRWAVDSGADVINLSIGGLRDPTDPERDTFSELERTAIEYARSNGVVVVAAVGNGDQAPSMPWPYASYPAALPHVIGVGGIDRRGAVPSFSNRDRLYNDIVAPAVDILSTFPRVLTAARPSCVEQGYSSCAPLEYSHPEGTSFAAPQVSAAAALLLTLRPDLEPNQVAALLTHTALDAHEGTGCPRCSFGRDALGGWGRLDITAALQALHAASLPPPDRLEANDNAGDRAATLWGRRQKVAATVDFWDDPIDVYRIWLRRGERIFVSAGLEAVAAKLMLWKPGTTEVQGSSAAVRSQRAAEALHAGPRLHLSHRAQATGWYYVEVQAVSPASSPYTLRLVKQL
jgi:subtilisin family serine protease